MARDLSLDHRPISDFLKLPQSKSDWDKYRLSQEQIDSYHENGFLAGVRILDDQQIEILRNEVSELFNPKHDGSEYWYEYHSNESADPNKVLFHALGAWRIQPGLHDILWHPAFTMAVSQLLGGIVRFWHDQLFCKPAKHGGVVAWHQDYSYWTRTKPLQHITCWIGLDPATVANGCVHYIPGSHRWDLLPITGLAGNMDAIREVLNDEQWEQFQKPVPVELKAGESIFHHGLTIHGSFANTTDIPRRAVVLNAFLDGTLSDSNDVLLSGVPVVPKGSPMQGQFFPLLFDPKQTQ